MQPKSFVLSKEVRSMVADKLTVKFASGQAKAFEKKLDKINKAFWSEHRKKVGDILKISEDRYPELIQAGCLTATSSAVFTRKDLIVVESPYNDGPEARMLELLRASPEFSVVRSYILYQRFHGHVLRLTADKTYPSFNEAGTPSDEFMALAKPVVQSLSKLIEQAVEFHEQTKSILISCKTSRQLTDLFPEAASFLPKPESTDKKLMPIEQVKDIQAMLKTGPQLEG